MVIRSPCSRMLQLQLDHSISIHFSLLHRSEGDAIIVNGFQHGSKRFDLYSPRCCCYMKSPLTLSFTREFKSLGVTEKSPEPEAEPGSESGLANISEAEASRDSKHQPSTSHSPQFPFQRCVGTVLLKLEYSGSCSGTNWPAVWAMLGVSLNSSPSFNGRINYLLFYAA